MTDGAPDVSDEAEAAAGWWADVLRGEPTFSNGDAFAGALASAISDRRDDMPEDQIQAFEAELQSLIENRLTEMLQKSSDYTMYLNTDYSPMGELAEAAADAGIDAGMTAFPWKTGMWIEPGTVKVSDSSGNPSDEDGRAVIYAEPNDPDPVTDGGARYAYSILTDTWYKVTEYDELGDGEIRARAKEAVDREEVPQDMLDATEERGDGPDPDPDHDAPVEKQLTDRQRELVEDDGGPDDA